MRCLPWHHVFSGGKVYFYDPDSYIRIRKTLSYLNGFPASSIHDYFQGYPIGTGVITPPILEYAAAFFLLPFRTSEHLAVVLQQLYAIIPPIAGALSCLLVFFFLHKKLGTAPGLTGALVMAIHPFHIESTMLGRYDNEMLEVLLFSLTCYTYFRTFDGDKKSWLQCALISLLFLGVWRGAMVILALIGVDCLFRVLNSRTDVQARIDAAGGAALMYFSSASFVAIICLTNAWGSRHLFSFNVISWFHVTAFLFASILFCSVMYFLKNINSFALSSKVSGFVLLLAGATAAALFGDSIKQSFNVIGGGNFWVDSISQYQQSVGPWQILRSATDPVIVLSLLTLPIPFPHSLLKIRAFVKTALFFTLALMLLRTRFAHFSVPVMSIMSGVAVHSLSRLFSTRFGTRYLKHVTVFLVTSIAGILVIFHTDSYTSAYTGGTAGIAVVKGDVEETMEWIKNNTPAPGDAFRPWLFPDYGICARWEYGALLETLAQRPSVATNYGTEAPGMALAGRILTEPDSKIFISEMHRDAIRYLVIDKLSDDLTMYAKASGKNQLYFTETKDPNTSRIIKVPLPSYLKLVSTRLHLMDGVETVFNGMRFDTVEGMRLVYESRSRSNFIGAFADVKKIKVFERVNGARVNVHGIHGDEVLMEQLIETNQGRRFINRVRKTFDKSGSTSFRIHYPAKTNKVMTGSISDVVISTKQTRVTIKAELEDILGGAALRDISLL